MSRPLRFRYQLTRLGLHFVFVAAFTMIGGALRGFNLLLVLAGLLVGALLVQWRCSRWIISNTSVRRRFPSEAFAGVPFRVRYAITNLSRWLPIWMIWTSDQLENESSQTTTTLGCGVGMVAPTQTALAEYECLIPERGAYRFGPTIASTTFPFSLLHAKQVADSSDSLYVFPRLLQLRKGWQRWLVTKQGGAAATARRAGPSEGDFFGLREWQHGDNPKWIHCRTTARLGEPIVRQFEQQRRFDACLLVDCCTSVANDEDNDHDRPWFDPAVETAISFAATIVAGMDRAPSNQLVVSVAGNENQAVAGGRSRGGKRQMLQLLAAAEASEQPELAEAIDQVIQLVGDAKDLVIISTQSMSQRLAKANPQTPEVEKRLRRWARRGGLRWINVNSSDFRWWVTDPVIAPVSVSEQQVVDTPATKERDAQVA